MHVRVKDFEALPLPRPRQVALPVQTPILERWGFEVTNGGFTGCFFHRPLMAEKFLPEGGIGVPLGSHDILGGGCKDFLFFTTTWGNDPI